MRVIGIGHAGGHVVDALRKEGLGFVGIDGFCPVRGLIDQRAVWEAVSPIEDPDEARAYTRRVTDRILDAFWDGDDVDPIVVLVASLHEPIGVGATPVLAQALAGHGACVVPVIVSADNVTARLAMRCLSEHAASVVAIERSLLRSDIDTNDDPSLLELVAATMTVAENGALSAGGEASAEVYRQSGRLARFTWACAPQQRQRTLTNAAFASLPTRAQSFATAYVLRLSGPGLRLGDEQVCARDLIRAARRDVDVVASLSPDERRDRVELGVVALGVDPPPRVTS